MATPALAVSISTAPHNIPPPRRGIAFVGSNGHVAEAGHVEHETSLAGGVSGIAVASAADGEWQMIGVLRSPAVAWMSCGLAGCTTSAGCAANLAAYPMRSCSYFASPGRKTVPVSPRAKAVSLASLGFETGSRRGLLRKAAPREKWKGRTKALPEERTPIHRCPLLMMDRETKCPTRVLDSSAARMRASPLVAPLVISSFRKEIAQVWPKLDHFLGKVTAD